MRLAPTALLLIAACAPEPTLRVMPERGSSLGGQAIRIEGDGFVGRGPPVVYVGSVAAKAVVVQSRWLITAMTPARDAEVDPVAVDVAVVFADGTSLAILRAFTYEDDEGFVLRPGGA